MKFYPDNDLYKYYKKYADNAWLSLRIQDHTLRRTLEILNRAINCCERWDSFMDIGAGNGRNSATLLHKFKHGYAIEVDPNDALKKIDRENTNLKVLLKPIQEVKITKKIDFILLSDVIEHIPVRDIAGVVRSISGLQERGGVLYILTPNAIFCGPAEKSGIYFKRHKYGHHKQYTRVELVQLFTKYGYKAVFTRYEDSRIRLILKMPMIVLSFLDKKYFSNPVLSFLTAPSVFLIDTFGLLLGLISYTSEILHQHDDFSTRSVVIVFKKIG